MTTLACNLPFTIVWTGGSETDQKASDQVKTEAEDASSAGNENGDESKEGDSTIAEDVPPTEKTTATPSATDTITPTLMPAIANVE